MVTTWQISSTTTFATKYIHPYPYGYNLQLTVYNVKPAARGLWLNVVVPCVVVWSLICQATDRMDWAGCPSWNGVLRVVAVGIASMAPGWILRLKHTGIRIIWVVICAHG